MDFLEDVIIERQLKKKNDANNIMRSELGYKLTREKELEEYKEFVLLDLHNDKTVETRLLMDEFILSGKITKQIQNIIMRSLSLYIKKYFIRYFVSFNNYRIKWRESHGNFYIGIDDDGSITGVPVLSKIPPEIIRYTIYNSIKKSLKRHDIYILKNGELCQSEEIINNSIKRLGVEIIELDTTKIDVHENKMEYNSLTLLMDNYFDNTMEFFKKLEKYEERKRNLKTSYNYLEDQLKLMSRKFRANVENFLKTMPFTDEYRKWNEEQAWLEDRYWYENLLDDEDLDRYSDWMENREWLESMVWQDDDEIEWLRNKEWLEDRASRVLFKKNIDQSGAPQLINMKFDSYFEMYTNILYYVDYVKKKLRMNKMYRPCEPICHYIDKFKRLTPLTIKIIENNDVKYYLIKIMFPIGKHVFVLKKGSDTIIYERRGKHNPQCKPIYL